MSLTGYGGIPSYQKLGANIDYNYYVSQYDGEIRYEDTHLGRLIDSLKKSGLYDDALIIFTADHGEGMGGHDYYFAHGENLYNDLIQVPLIVKYGKELVGRRSDFVQHIDIVPTILEILGIKAPLPYRGKDLRRQHETNREIFAEMNSPLVRGGLKFSIIIDGLKLIYTPIYDHQELFDLNSDPYEEHNLAADSNYLKQLKHLKDRLEYNRFKDLLGLRIENAPLPVTPEEAEKLRTIGY